EIANIREGVGGIGGGWFRESVMKQMGDGAATFFWIDPWLGGSPLCETFGRLFDLAVNKSCSVAEMFTLGWEVAGEEEMLGECQALLLNFSFQAQ
ncbi:receptor-like kinase, partial [Trifolium medium]|nr:receptor-like kinase [Trifolium medium]